MSRFKSTQFRCITKACSSRGYTLIELLTVMTIIGILAMVALPSFIDSYHRLTFQNTVKAVGALYERARTQALASEIDSSKKMPSGGYGVWLGVDGTDDKMKAVLFIDDYNAASSAKVQMDYADATTRVVSDGSYKKATTAGYTDGDTVLGDSGTVVINEKDYVKLVSLKGLPVGVADTSAAWSAAPEILPSALGTTGGLPMVFVPPFADAKIGGATYGKLRAVFQLGTSTNTRTLLIDRVTTTAQITNP